MSAPPYLSLYILTSSDSTANTASKWSNAWFHVLDASGSVSAAKTVEIRHSALITSMAFLSTIPFDIRVHRAFGVTVK